MVIHNFFLFLFSSFDGMQLEIYEADYVLERDVNNCLMLVTSQLRHLFL